MSRRSWRPSRPTSARRHDNSTIHGSDEVTPHRGQRQWHQLADLVALCMTWSASSSWRSRMGRYNAISRALTIVLAFLVSQCVYPLSASFQPCLSASHAKTSTARCATSLISCHSRPLGVDLVTGQEELVGPAPHSPVTCHGSPYRDHRRTVGALDLNV